MNYTNYNHKYRRNRIVEPAQLVATANIFTPTVDQKYMLGTILDLNGGRRFRYCKNDSTEIAKAVMVQSSVPIAGNTEEVNTNGTAASAKDQSLTIGVTTTIAEDALVDGWLNVVDVTAAALGDLYLIKSNTAGTTPVITLADAGGLRTAIAVTTEITVIKNKYRDVVVVPKAAGTAVPVGVTQVVVTASYYFWAQTRGYASILVDTDTVIVGNPVGESTTGNVNGGVGVVANDGTDPVWGICVVLGTAGQTDQPAIIDLTLE